MSKNVKPVNPMKVITGPETRWSYANPLLRIAKEDLCGAADRTRTGTGFCPSRF